MSDAETFYNRGLAFYAQGRFADALAAQDAALALAAGHPNVQLQRGLCLRQLGDGEAALAAYDAALKALPRDSEILTNRGNVLHDLNRHDEAVAAFDAALAVDARNAGAWSNRGTALIALLRAQDALDSFSRALALSPRNAEFVTNRGVALRELGRLDDAVAAFEQALAIEPGRAEAEFNLAVTLIPMGDFARGNPLYEARKRLNPPVEARTYAQPLWTGAEDISGKIVFVYVEQGLGDAILCYRFVAPLFDRGARVVLAASKLMAPLFATAMPKVDVIGPTDVPDAFDYHIPLLSLPLALGLGGDRLSASVPYLHAEPARIARWKEKLGDHGFKIGIAWHRAGGGMPDRFIPLSMFAGLAALPGVRLISLHKGLETSELPAVENLGTDLDRDAPFLDTAAVMANCDLVISLDSAPAHLAGALGVPSWFAIRCIHDWRWQFGRDDSAWYPSVRLFRQPAPGDWASVFETMRGELQGLLA